MLRPGVHHRQYTPFQPTPFRGLTQGASKKSGFLGSTRNTPKGAQGTQQKRICSRNRWEKGDVQWSDPSAHTHTHMTMDSKQRHRGFIVLCSTAAAGHSLGHWGKN
mmetsp:Transcript_8742/g.21973  ORF Transcript_8742/g.21973 Transcript_8742/m.21973 type:complete len:106 (-) Transcript_8742:2137-2454(-)|eukprot:397697-Pelagomonas_calceolata.AAC.2